MTTAPINIRASLVVYLLLIYSLSITSTVAQQSAEEVMYEQKIYKQVDTIALTAHIFYLPSTLKKSGNTGLAFFHGGGWSGGKPEEFFNACRRYAAMGMVAVSFQYRLVKGDALDPNKKTTPIDCIIDARSALRWLREHADAYHIASDKIVAGGQSVGAHLVLSTAMIDAYNAPTDNMVISPVPNALILWSGTVNTIEAWADLQLGNQREKIWSISPFHNIKKGMPPVIAFHGLDDDMVLFYTVSLFVNQMKAAGNYVELHEFEGRKHYLGAGSDQYATLFDDEILLTTDAFLKKFGFMAP